MNRYAKVFRDLRNKKEGALIPFTVIGDPDCRTSLEIVKNLAKCGADILELGLAFSDPIADGPTIQLAHARALSKKINTDRAFEFIRKIRRVTDTPLGLLVYYNLVYQRGIEKFYQDAGKAGVDSVLIADMPVEEADNIVGIAQKNKLDSVFIASPLTNKKRLSKIIKKTTGFIYIVSRLGVTGVRKDMQQATLELIRRIRRNTDLPLCVGFGISKPKQVNAVLKAGADGAITGSAVVSIIEKNLENKKRMLKKIRRFVVGMKKATKKTKKIQNL